MRIDVGIGRSRIVVVVAVIDGEAIDNVAAEILQIILWLRHFFSSFVFSIFFYIFGNTPAPPNLPDRVRILENERQR